MNGMGGERFCEGFVESTGFGVEKRTRLCVTCNGMVYRWSRDLQGSKDKQKQAKQGVEECRPWSIRILREV